MIRTLHRSRAVRALWAASFLVSGSLAAPAAAQRVVRVGLHDAHPIAFRDAQTGEVRGFGVEVLQHIADEELFLGYSPNSSPAWTLVIS